MLLERPRRSDPVAKLQPHGQTIRGAGALHPRRGQQHMIVLLSLNEEWQTNLSKSRESSWWHKGKHALWELRREVKPNHRDWEKDKETWRRWFEAAPKHWLYLACQGFSEQRREPLEKQLQFRHCYQNLAKRKHGCRKVRVYPMECSQWLERDPSNSWDKSLVLKSFSEERTSWGALQSLQRSQQHAPLPCRPNPRT